MTSPSTLEPLTLADAGLLRDRAYIGGRWTAADSGRDFAVTNPADGAEIGRVPDLGAAETRRAIEAAETALPTWRARTAKQRSGVLRRWYELTLEHAEDRAVQAESVRRFERLRDDAPEFGDVMQRSLAAVYEHRDTVERFGRFPHRNELLGRASTPDELAFLEAGARTYGQ